MPYKFSHLSAVKSFSRLFIEQTAEGYYRVQDFYTTGEKRSDPFVLLEKTEDFAYELIPIEGALVLYYKTGIKEQQLNYQAGQRHGQWQGWYIHGQLAGEGCFVAGLKQGCWRKYWVAEEDSYVESHYHEGWLHGSHQVIDGGKLILVGELEQGVRVGTWVSYYDNGQKATEKSYIQGLEEGLFVSWNDSGQKILEGYFHAGEQEGWWVTYYDNGQKEQQQCYVRGLSQGLYQAWYDDGQKQSEGNYYAGEREGTWRSWYSNG